MIYSDINTEDDVDDNILKSKEHLYILITN